MMSENKINLSYKNYAISVVLRYVSLLVIIAVTFLPILSINLTKTNNEVTLNISPYQFLTDTAQTKITVNLQDEEGGEFFESILESIEIDVMDVLIDGNSSTEQLIYYSRLICIIIAVVIALINFLANKANVKSLYKPNAKNGEILITNQKYITATYGTLPRFFEAVKIFFAIVIFFVIFFFNTFAYSLCQQNTSISVNYIPSLVFLAIVFALVNYVPAQIICAKNMKLIKDGNARFDEPYEIPTFSNDLKAIKDLFTNSASLYRDDQDAKLEELYKYKRLLDDGIITEEEFQQKKNELFAQDR